MKFDTFLQANEYTNYHIFNYMAPTDPWKPWIALKNVFVIPGREYDTPPLQTLEL